MAVTNKRTKSDYRCEKTARLAGGFGTRAAKQGSEDLLRRSVMACLLWEDIAYEDGSSVAQRIAFLVPQVEPLVCADIACEARHVQKLRHVPLLIVREMARHATHKPFVKDTLCDVICRADELAEFLAIYWRDGKCALANCVKQGLAKAFQKFDEYQLAKWSRDKDITLRDVMFMVHPKPVDDEQAAIWKRLAENELATPATWEVGLSAARGEEQKRHVWESLIGKNKLGAMAVLKNLRNMQQVGVPRDTISHAIEHANPAMLLPINFLSARDAAPDFTRSIESLMFRCAAEWQKLPGWTIFVVDVSGSMLSPVSLKSAYTRMEVAASMSILAAEVCENLVVYATAGSDSARVHNTEKIKPHRGFALADEIRRVAGRMGGGGIFTRQCLEYIRAEYRDAPDRIIVFSDSQDCDLPSRQIPVPFGKQNYIIDISCEKHGIAYDKIWTAEIAGWSEHFLRYIANHETPNISQGHVPDRGEPDDGGQCVR